MPVMKKPAAQIFEKYVALGQNIDLDIMEVYKVAGGGTFTLEWDFNKRPRVTKCPGKGFFPTYALSIRWNHYYHDCAGVVRQARFAGWTNLKKLKLRHGNQ